MSVETSSTKATNENMKRSNVGVHGGNDHFYLLIFVSVTILNYPFEKIDHPIVGYVVAFIVFVIVLALMIAPHMEVVDSRYDVVVRLDGTTKGIGLLCLVSSLLLGNVAFVNYSGRNLAVDYSNFNEPTIINGNLYYFSWASFLSSAQLFVKSYNNLFGIPVIRNWDSADDFTDLVGASRIRRFSCWVWLFLSNTIVALSATAVYINECQGDEMKVSRRELNKFCMKNETSLAISIVTSLFPIVVMCTKFDLDEYDSFPLLLERVISIVILVVNMVSIFIGTYYNGPASSLGNYYYSLWLSLIFCWKLVLSTFREQNLEPKRAHSRLPDNDSIDHFHLGQLDEFDTDLDEVQILSVSL